ncbi:lytic transglycosylase domain-containing protein [Streptomyces yaanensis]|uniref:Lytic transglycosylase domain-containing protein n=1 Tax=Streptomyces yaanensis TaxID=1142239 RepID=A0ABV7SC32_9ACTN|nr:lytic transglycosylase domain-containing protein [Streptomyces sp. CGMCC 4.7035]WNB98662.1 lytic transglycosylase domain-containing protein [Streptomyces sp. CGMCC 4.7035]
MAALTASQAPGAAQARASVPARSAAPAEHGPSVSGDAPYRTALPPLRAGKPKQGTASQVAGGALPASVFAAYRRAEAELARTAPGCRLRWQLLAAIGQVESGQARGGRVTSDGTTVTPILGPRLTGGAFAVVRDTDGGAQDGDAVYDRAVGPMQFIPSTWARWGADGNGDGRADPNNVFDAALAAGRYLCAGGRDLSNPADLDRAILGYNHSEAYLRTVRAWYAYFLEGHRVVPGRRVVGPAGAVRAGRAEAVAAAVRPPPERGPVRVPRAVHATGDPLPHPVPYGRCGGADRHAAAPRARAGRLAARPRTAQRRAADQQR